MNNVYVNTKYRTESLKIQNIFGHQTENWTWCSISMFLSLIKWQHSLRREYSWKKSQEDSYTVKFFFERNPRVLRLSESVETKDNCNYIN